MLTKKAKLAAGIKLDIQEHSASVKSAYLAVPDTGLTSLEVNERQASNRINVCPRNTSSVWSIVQRNLFNIFNFVNFFLAFLIVWAASFELTYLKNGLFMGVVVSNLVIALNQELKAKFLLDKLAILLNPEIKVKRDGRELTINSEQLVQNDLFQVQSGLQLPVDGIVISADELTVDEALLTGEADLIIKKSGDVVFAGSICQSGTAWVEACLLGTNSFANKITLAAKKTKREKSELRLGLNRLITILSTLILPIACLLFYKNYGQKLPLPKNLVVTVAAVIGMIPEGLILLCEIAFATATLNLAKVNCLVQCVSAVEMLARTDVLCLDKTGTLTSGKMELVDFIEQKATKLPKELSLKALVKYMFNLNASGNLTEKAILKSFQAIDTVQVKELLGKIVAKQAFNSERKYQSVKFQNFGIFYLGATEFILAKQGIPAELAQCLSEYSEEAYRILLLAWQENEDTAIEPLAFLLLSDEIRSDAAETLTYFREQGVAIKIISGDNPKTLSAIAKRVGLKHTEYIDLSCVTKTADYKQLVQKYQLFGRVSPWQKEQLVQALQENKHVVTMTGDGVNDVPALKKSDCAVAMLKGSDACRKSSDLVLLQDNLAALVPAVYEGRRVINNIKLVASLFLHKTIYACILAVFYLFSQKLYPLYPIQLTLISTLTIGVPAFFLTLQKNKERLTGRFWQDVLSPAIAAALISLSLIVIFELCLPYYSTYSAYRQIYILLCLAASAFALLVYVAHPLNKLKITLLVLLVLAFSLALLLLPNLLSLPLLNLLNLLFFSLWVVFVYLLTQTVLKLVPIFTKYCLSSR